MLSTPYYKIQHRNSSMEEVGGLKTVFNNGTVLRQFKIQRHVMTHQKIESHVVR